MLGVVRGGIIIFSPCPLARGQILPAHTEKFIPVWVKETLFIDVLRLDLCFGLSLPTIMKYYLLIWKSYLPLVKKKVGGGTASKKPT